MHAGRAGGMVVLRRGAKDVRGPGGMWVRFAPRGQRRPGIGRDVGAFRAAGPKTTGDRAGVRTYGAAGPKTIVRVAQASGLVA